MPSVSNVIYQSVSEPAEEGEYTDICYLSLRASEILWKLGNDGHGQGQLSLSATKFAENFAYTHGLEATGKC